MTTDRHLQLPALAAARPVTPAARRSHRPVVVVIGPSAVGKSTAVRACAAAGAVRVHPTWTTRPRRRSEVPPDVEHRFVSDAVFDAWAAAGCFAAMAALPGLPHRYGLPVLHPSDHGPADLVMARAATVGLLRQLGLDVVVVQVEAEVDVAADRLRARGLDETEVAARLGTFDAELHAGRRIADCVVVNDGDVDALVGALAAAVRSTARRAPVRPAAAVTVGPPHRGLGHAVVERRPARRHEHLAARLAGHRVGVVSALPPDTPGIQPPGPQRAEGGGAPAPPVPRQRLSAGMVVVLVIVTVLAVVGLVFVGLVVYSMWAFSQWGSNK